MILQPGRPADAKGRSEKELNVYDFLDSLKIDYHRVDHEPAMTMEICREIESVLGAPICKNLFLCNRQQTDFYLLLMPGDKPFKTKNLSAQIGSSRLSFATASHMEQFLGVTPGSASVLGLMNDREHSVKLVIDREVLRQEWIGCHPCINTSSLRFSTETLTRVILPALGVTPTLVELPLETE